MAEDVNFRLKNDRYKRQDNEWRAIQSFSDRRDKINPEAAAHPGESRAEEQLIYFLYSNPDLCADILGRLPPEKFVTSFNRRVYESLTAKITEGADHSVSSFNDEFSVDEMGKITSILSEYEDKGIDRQVAEDCVRVISEYVPDKPKAEEMSDDDFILLAKSLKRKKNKS